MTPRLEQADARAPGTSREEDRYDLMLTGHILPGHKREVVAAALAQLMRLPEARALQLLAGQERVVKRDLDAASLRRYVAALRKAGAETRTVTIAAAVAPQGMTVASASAKPDISELSEKDLLALRGRFKTLPVGVSLMDCPCCRIPTLQQRGSGESCTVCGWQDFPGQNEYYPDKVVPGRNFGLSLNAARQEFEAHGSADPRNYTPNAVPLRKRVINGLIGLFLAAYCAYSLWIDQLYIPFINRHFPGQSGKAITFRGIDAWVMAAALMCTVAFCVLSIADHYDRRRNERHYQKAVQACMLLFAVLMGIALVMHTYRAEGLGSALGIAVGMLVIIPVLIFRFRSGPIEY